MVCVFCRIRGLRQTQNPLSEIFATSLFKNLSLRSPVFNRRLSRGHAFKSKFHKRSRRPSFEQEITARRSRNQRRRKTTANRHECSAFIRVHSWLEECSQIRAILNIGTAKITERHSSNQKRPGKNR